MDDTKKITVKRRGLSEFLIKFQGGGSPGGEIVSTYTNESHQFSDVNDIINIIERHCDKTGYPQSHRKLRGWDA